jgi:hypothetical protein
MSRGVVVVNRRVAILQARHNKAVRFTTDIVRSRVVESLFAAS